MRRGLSLGIEVLVPVAGARRQAVRDDHEAGVGVGGVRSDGQLVTVYSVDTTIFVGPTCLISVPMIRDSDQFDSRMAPDVYW